jgi:hypothetical protein
LADTDDDGFADNVEIRNRWSPISSSEPGHQRVLALDGAPGSFVESLQAETGALTNRLA